MDNRRRAARPRAGGRGASGRAPSAPPRPPLRLAAGRPNVQEYVRDLHATLRQRDVAAYRQLLARWRGLHESGVADRLLGLDDDALRRRIYRMILDTPALADLHAEAERWLEEQGGES